jgi:hypothetical protein
MKYVLRIGLLFVLIMAVVAGLAPVSIAGSESDDVVQLTRIGHPTWKPVDFHMFSAPIGTAASGYAEFGDTALAILPPPNHVVNPDLLVGPGAPHSPSYTNEVAHGVAELKYHQGQRFNTSEFSSGNGVWLVWMNVPKPGATGSSPDFDSGPIMLNSLFPIHVKAITLRNGADFNPYVADVAVLALNALTTPFNVDGASHFPVFIADNMDFAPPGTKPAGRYEYRITMLDQQGNGWSIVAQFTVMR